MNKKMSTLEEIVEKLVRGVQERKARPTKNPYPRFIYLDHDRYRFLVTDPSFRKYGDFAPQQNCVTRARVMGTQVIEVRERDHFEILWEG